MENNQFNPQQGQPNPAPQQGQQMGQQFTQPQQGQQMGQQFAQPQQGQQMGQRPQPQQGQQMGQRPQPQQGQQMGQRPQPQQMQQQFAQPQQMQPVAPKAPMSMEKRSLFIAISLLAVAVILFTLSPIKNRYYDNSALGTFDSIFTSIFSLVNFAFLLITLIVGALLFVPKWSKQFLNYTNSRLVILATAGTSAILSIVHFIMILTDTIQKNSLYGELIKKLVDRGYRSDAIFYAAPESFKFDFILIPLAALLAVTALVLALPLLKKPLKKDHFISGLVIISVILLFSLLLVFIFFFFGKAGITSQPATDASKFLW